MKTIKNILDARKLAPHKSLGQNFLVHQETAGRIVDLADFSVSDTVIELGVGLGALTFPLASRVKKVIGLEIDRGIVKLHTEENDLPENVTLLHEDLLKTDYQKLFNETGDRLKIIANLPYSISNPLLFKLLENREIMHSAVLMLQKEVGERLIAGPGTKEYGVLSVLLGSCAQVEFLMRLGPGHFHPKPKVDSVVARIIFYPPPQKTAELPPFDPVMLARVVKAAFGQRRKKIINALSASPFLGRDKNDLSRILSAINIAETRRAENLSVSDYVMLSNKISNG